MTSNLQIQKPGFTNCYTTNNFVNAFDQFKDINRKLFDIVEIDKFLSFEDKKNICIVIKSSSDNTTNFLHSIIANVCVSFHLTEKKCCHRDSSSSMGEKKTILVDAGNGNNLGYVYLDLVKKSSRKGTDIMEILKQITVVRAFTFYQLLNIIINEIPEYILHSGNNCKIQIIILDFLDTFLTSTFKTNVKNNATNQVLIRISKIMKD